MGSVSWWFVVSSMCRLLRRCLFQVRLAFALALALAVLSAPVKQAHAGSEQQTDYHLLFYAARIADSRLWGDILRDQSADYVDSWLVQIAPGLTLGSWPDERLRWELEGQIVKHFERQSHWELNAALVARWTQFPWNHKVNTTIAVGEGVSWASTRPPLEMLGNSETRSFLNYILIEMTFAPPGNSPWELVARIHHRSGVFGLYGISGGSNALGLGVRWRF